MSFLLKCLVPPALSLVLAGCGSSAAPKAQPEQNANAPAITVLSNRADLISGGDALVEVRLTATVADTAPQIRLNGKDVSARFAAAGARRYIGLVDGLENGSNVLSAADSLGQSGEIRIVNYPQGGPVFSGPQLQPWTCQDGAQDAQCNQPPVYSWYYKSRDPAQPDLLPYDPANPPADVADTTTDQGSTVPYIVRVETGYQDRGQYALAMLYEPGRTWTAAAPQPQFNHKLLIEHGAYCAAEYTVGTAPSVITDLSGSAVYALGAGFAVMSTALVDTSHNCSNLALQAESLMMAKEHLIEQYGTLRYTIGIGCSGGSMTTQALANAYPGIHQGIVPDCSFADILSTATQVLDLHLLQSYFAGLDQNTQPQWPLAARAAVEGGKEAPFEAARIDSVFFTRILPTYNCAGITDLQRYEPNSNPGGVRCSILEPAINLLGPRPPEVWNASEKTIGRGYMGLAVDNNGVQYGLAALQDGTITAEQFLDLNARVGGFDIDLNRTPARLTADQPALTNAYRSGLLNVGNNLGSTAIIDCRGPNFGLVHDSFRSFAIRARLDQELGGHENQVIWEGPHLFNAYNDCVRTGLMAMDRWLAAVENDLGAQPLPTKLIANKPGDLGDACWSAEGKKLSNRLCPETVVPIYGTPRTVAGDGISTATNKCQLRPPRRSDDYGGPRSLSDAQWQKLQQIFPDGVCDFSLPPAGKQATLPWMTYQDERGDVIYGGKALPPPVPADSGSGWSSAAFRGTAGVAAQ